MSRRMQRDAIVVGGGVVGAVCALAVPASSARARAEE